jgi:hypothetical protein
MRLDVPVARRGDQRGLCHRLHEAHAHTAPARRRHGPDCKRRLGEGKKVSFRGWEWGRLCLPLISSCCAQKQKHIHTHSLFLTHSLTLSLSLSLSLSLFPALCSRSCQVRKLGYLYVVMPALTTSMTLVLVAVIINNIPRNRRYPQHWW